MVWLGLKMGFEAGKTPKLKLIHLISGQKANRKYLRRWIYGGALGNLGARLEIFPEERIFFENQILSKTKATLLLIKIFFFNFYHKDLDLALIRQIGSIDGYSRVFGHRPPWLSLWLKRFLKLD